MARKVGSKFVPATPQVLLQRETPTHPRALVLCSCSRLLLLPPAAGDGSAGAWLVAAALQPCFQLARQLGSCSNELARCLRHAVMMRSPCRRSVSCELCELFLFPKPRVAPFRKNRPFPKKAKMPILASNRGVTLRRPKNQKDAHLKMEQGNIFKLGIH